MDLNEEMQEKQEKPETRHTSNIKTYIIFFIIFIFAGMIILYPIFFFINSNVSGLLGIEDSTRILWFYWIFELDFQEQWAGLRSAGFSFSNILNHLYNIFSFPIRYKIGNFFDFVPTLIMKKILPFPFHYNLKIFITFVLNSFCFFLLSFYLYRDTLTSFVTGLMFTCMPFFFQCASYGFLDMIYIFPVPLYILFLLKTLHDDLHHLRNSILAGFFLGLSSILYWFNSLYLVFFTLFYLFYYPFCRWKPKNYKKAAIFLPVLVIVFILIVMPFLYPYQKWLKEGRKLEYENIKFFSDFPVFADYLNFTASSREMNIIEDACSAEYPVRRVGENYVPVIMLILIVLSLIFIRRIPLYLYFALVFYYMISLGPYLKFAGKVVEPPTRLLVYAFLYKFIPFFSRLGWPSRAQSFFIIIGLLIAGYVLLYLKNQLRGHRFMKCMPATFSFIIFFLLVMQNGFIPFKATPFYIPGYYFTIARDEKAVGVVELPLCQEEFFSGQNRNISPIEPHHYNINTYYQIYHKKRIYEGKLEIYRDVEKELLGNLRQLSINPYVEEPFNKYFKPYFFLEGYHYLVVHKRHFRRLLYYRYKHMLTHEDISKLKIEEANKILDDFFDKYISRMEKEFGPPVAVDYDLLWEGKPWLYVKGQGYRGYYLEKTPIYFFKIKDEEANRIFGNGK